MHERCGVPAHKDLLQTVAGMEGPDRHRAEEVIEAQSMSAPCCELMQENFTYFLKTASCMISASIVPVRAPLFATPFFSTHPLVFRSCCVGDSR